MAFLADYHTHTTYSHGKGSVLDNAVAAAEKGLKQIAVTDHGLSHYAFGIKLKEIDQFIRDCHEATEKTGVLVLVGIENNVNSFEGTLDVPPDVLEKLEIIQGGYHKAAQAPTFRQQMSYQLRNFFYSTFTKVPKKLIVRNTDAYLKLLDNYEIDFIGHLNRDIHTDALTVARYAKQKGTYIELNNKNLSLTDEELEKMAEEGVRFVCNSDAHRPERVGNCSGVLEVIERVGIPFELIGNWDKLPDFRSSNYKRGMERAKATIPGYCEGVKRDSFFGDGAGEEGEDKDGIKE